MDVDAEALRSLLGKHYRRYGQKVWNDLSVLQDGIKSTYLVDESFVSAQKWTECLGKICAVSPTGLSLCCVTLGHDVVIVNLPLLQRRLKNDVTDHFSSIRFVNVSGHLERPELIDLNVPGWEHVRLMLERVLFQLERIDAVFSGETASPAAVHCLDVDPSWNLTSVFGWLLGYPVVYWFDQRSVDRGVNCLGMEPLCVYEVVRSQGDSANLSSHTVWSFSVPCALRDVCEPAIQAWWQLIETSSSAHCHLSLKRTERTLPDVAL